MQVLGSLHGKTMLLSIMVVSLSVRCLRRKTTPSEMQGDGSASRYAKTPGTESMVKTGGKLGDQLSLGTESRVS